MQKVFRALVVAVPRRLAKSGSPLLPKEPSDSVAQLDEDIDCCFHDYQFSAIRAAVQPFRMQDNTQNRTKTVFSLLACASHP